MPPQAADPKATTSRKKTRDGDRGDLPRWNAVDPPRPARERRLLAQGAGSEDASELAGGSLGFRVELPPLSRPPILFH
jgi:hypothetical protein